MAESAEILTRRIKAYKAQGMDTTELERQLDDVLAAQGGEGEAQAKTPAKAKAAEPAAGEEWLDADLASAEAFERGFKGAFPPEKPGLYPVRITGVIIPTGNLEQRWFSVETTDKNMPYKATGNMVFALETEPGCGRFKDTLTALKIPYKVQGNVVRFKNPKGVLCKALWAEQFMKKSGKTQMMIVDLLPLEAESL